MKEHGFYHPEKGYWQTIGSPTKEHLSQYPSGTKEIPTKPGPGYEYSGTEWVAPSQEWLDDTKATEVRYNRDYLLRIYVDPIVTNHLRWGELSEENKNIVKQYRKALLDITKQEGFPHSVTWPGPLNI